MLRREIPPKVTGDNVYHWICVCGNDSDQGGFDPCDQDGTIVMPIQGVWEEPLYKCGRCGRIVHATTHDVVGCESVDSVRQLMEEVCDRLRAQAEFAEPKPASFAVPLKYAEKLSDRLNKIS